MLFEFPVTFNVKEFTCATVSNFPSWMWNDRSPSLGEDPSWKDAHHSFVRASAHQNSNMGAPSSSLREIHALNNLSCQIKWKCLQKSPSIFQLMLLSSEPMLNSKASSGVSVNNSVNLSVSEIVRNCISMSVCMATNLLSFLFGLNQHFLSANLSCCGIRTRIHIRVAFVGNRSLCLLIPKS